MTFAINRIHRVQPARPRRTDKKRSPLKGLLGKGKTSPEDKLPELDVKGGLNRALKNTQSGREQSQAPVQQDHHNPARDALAAIEAALYAIDRVRDILEQACDISISAKEAADAGGRSLLAESYDELRLSIGEALEKIDPRATILIGKGQKNIDVLLGGRTKYSVSPVRLDIGENGLDLPPPADAFARDEEINEILAHLDKALAKVDRAAAGYCRDAQYLISRIKAEAAANVQADYTS